MTYNNEGLVEHCKKALKVNNVYMWGGILRLVEKQYDTLKGIYGNQPGTGYSPERWAYLRSLFGKDFYGVDCVGLVKSYYWSGKLTGGVGSPNYASARYPDCSAADMYAAAKVKGKIGTLPEKKGIILYCRKNHHVGVYIGNGETIESTLGARGDGVVKRKIDKLWTDWFECPYITYKTDAPAKFAVGDKVIIKETATTYAGVATKIPETVKGAKHVYTIMQLGKDKALLKEIYSWVYEKDLMKIPK